MLILAASHLGMASPFGLAPRSVGLCICSLSQPAFLRPGLMHGLTIHLRLTIHDSHWGCDVCGAILVAFWISTAALGLSCNAFQFLLNSAHLIFCPGLITGLRRLSLAPPRVVRRRTVVGGARVVSGRSAGSSAGRSAGRAAGRPGGARVVSGAEKKII